MLISDIKTTLLSIPFAEPVVTSTFTAQNKHILLVEVETDEGVTGTSYLFTVGRGIHTLKTVIDKEIDDLVIGEDPIYRQKIWEKLWKGLQWIGRKGAAVFAISAIDIALWDIAGKVTDQSIHQMLGPARNSIEAYGGGGWLSYSIDEILEEVQSYKERGFQAYKMRVGLPDWREDLKRVKAVRETFGNEIEIMVDANKGLDLSTSILLGRELEQLNVFWFEEPVHADNIQGLAEIADSLDMRVATGESEYGRYGFKELIQRRAADVVQLDIQRVGGITEWIRVANTASSWDLKVTPHLFWEISVQLACAVPNAIYIEYMDWLDDCFEELPPIKDGRIHTWDKPGHGLKIKEEIIEKYEV